MGIYNTKNLEIEALNEVYFGQTPGITKVFDAFCKFRDKYVTNRKFFMFDIDADHDPDLADFIKEVEREFNIYSFSFLIENTDMPNMMTLMPYGNPSSTKQVEYKKSGYRFKDGTDACIIVIAPTGLLFNADITDREAFAIFLHEIGHNFQNVINESMCGLNMINKCLLVYNLVILLLIDQLSFIKNMALLGIANNKVLGQLSKILNKVTISDKKTIYSYYNFVAGIVKSVKFGTNQLATLVLGPILRIMNAVQKLIRNLSNPLNAIQSYRGEQMADRFPVMYGFGPDSYTADAKLDGLQYSTNVGSVVQKVPIVSHFFNLVALPADILNSLVDCHPGTASRMISYVDQFENDLKDPRIDPKAKKLIKKDLDQIRKSEKEIFDKNKKINNPRVVQWWYNNFIYHCCGGDIKYSISKKLFDDDKEINDLYYQNVNNESYINNFEVK